MAEPRRNRSPCPFGVSAPRLQRITGDWHRPAEHSLVSAKQKVAHGNHPRARSNPPNVGCDYYYIYY